MTLAKELGARPILARCTLGLGQLYRHAGPRPQAAEAFSQARALFQEMEMPFWLDRTEEAIRSL